MTAAAHAERKAARQQADHARKEQKRAERETK